MSWYDDDDYSELYDPDDDTDYEAEEADEKHMAEFAKTFVKGHCHRLRRCVLLLPPVPFRLRPHRVSELGFRHFVLQKYRLRLGRRLRRRLLKTTELATGSDIFQPLFFSSAKKTAPFMKRRRNLSPSLFYLV